ncbi:MAG TPA: DUF2059 domain-containing protein [Tabrizicola sp.]|nr:DUF2059 domain-containing protein [Tabrizicola sp.]
MSLPRFALIGFLSLALPVLADTSTSSKDDAVVAAQPPQVSIATLGKVLQFDPLFDVLREDGIAQASELRETLLQKAAGADWETAVDKIYDLRPLRARFNRALRVELAADPVLTAEILAFFASDLGQRILSLEIDARRVFLDIATEEAARVAADTPEAARDPKWRLIARLIEAGDLIESNVAGGLSGSLAFQLGLQSTGAAGPSVPVDQLAAEIWGQEEQMRSDLSAWLKAYFGLAYSSLTEAELETYVAFLESPAGRRYSRALFIAFEATFRPVSRDLGRLVGATMLERAI